MKGSFKSKSRSDHSFGSHENNERKFSISSLTSTPSSSGGHRSSLKKTKGLFGLLSRTKSVPPPEQIIITHEISTGPIPGITSVPTTPSPKHSVASMGSQEELSRVMLREHQSAPSSDSPGSCTGQRRTPRSPFSVTQTSMSSVQTPSPLSGTRGVGMPSASATSSSSSIFSASNMPRSPINNVIMEEEYDYPADLNSKKPSDAIDLSEPDEDLPSSPHSIYALPCDSMMSKSAEDNSSRTSFSRPGDMCHSRSSRSTSGDSANQHQGHSTGPHTSSSTEEENYSGEGAQSNSMAPSAAIPIHATTFNNNNNDSPRLQENGIAKATPCPRSGQCVTSPTPSGGPSTSPSDFVAPQGNTSLHHHPASPFEPLSRGPQPTSSTPPFGEQAAAARRLPTSSSGGNLHLGQLKATSIADSQPTYEEAWDLRMNRLGIDMARLATSAQPQDPPLSCGVPLPPVPPPLSSNVLSATTPPKPPPSFPPPPPPQQHQYPMGSSKDLRTSSRGSNRRGVETSKTPVPASITSGSLLARSQPPPFSQDPSAMGDYDYAYNKKWQMNAQMNLNISLNAPSAPNDPAPLPLCAPSPSIFPQECSSVPLPPSSHHRGGSCRGPRSPNTENSLYEEPWDKLHGSKIINKIAGSKQVSDTALTNLGTSGGPPRQYNRQWSQSQSGVYANDTIDVTLALDSQPWYHGPLTRVKAEELLSNPSYKEGSFLVRRSETKKDDYSLSIKINTTFLHMKITRNEHSHFVLGEYSQPYQTVPQMIKHYSHSLLPIKGASSVTLTYPVMRQSRIGS